MDLTYLDRARANLEKSIDLDELKSIRDKAEALRTYAGQATEMGRRCAERRLGELLAESVRPGNSELSSRTTIGLGDLGITRDQSSRWQNAATLPVAKFERYLESSHEPSTASVPKLVKANEREQAAADGPRSGGNILTLPASALWSKLADDSVSLILTDPPYSDLGLYGELAELAAAKLKPGGQCLAYAGQTYLPQVFEAMGRHLTYHWTFAIRIGGPHRAVYVKKIANSWFAVVAFSKGKSKADWIVDLLTSGGKEKDAQGLWWSIHSVGVAPCRRPVRNSDDNGWPAKWIRERQEQHDGEWHYTWTTVLNQ